MKWRILCFSFLMIIISCKEDHRDNLSNPQLISEIKNAAKNSGEPNLFVSESGQVYFSWIEYPNDTTDVLMFSVLENDHWSNPKTIAQGTNWFVNWADFPSLVAYKGNDNYLAAHWLQMKVEGTYDYDIRIAQSSDGGQSWSTSFLPHTDGVAAEHGFVSMIPVSNERIFAAWLDGRNTKNNTAENNQGHGGAMTLRTAEFDKLGKLYEETELDHRVCDCCQTSVAMTVNGPIVAYRDRSENEIRDISIVRKVNGTWTEPKRVFDDNWKIPGCPVNGPVIAANGSDVAVVWFTAPDNENGEVKVAFSDDAGATFKTPIRIDEGDPLGRVDAFWLNKNTVLVSWMEKTEKAAEIRVAKVSKKGKKDQSIKLIKSTASRDSGFPILAKSANRVFIAWTQVDSFNTHVKTGELFLK